MLMIDMFQFSIRFSSDRALRSSCVVVLICVLVCACFGKGVNLVVVVLARLSVFFRLRGFDRAVQ